MSIARQGAFKFARFVLDYDESHNLISRAIPPISAADTTPTEVIQHLDDISLSAFNPVTKVGIAAVVGKKKQQPHYIVSNSLDALSAGHFTNKAWDALFKKTFTHLSDTLEKAIREKGCLHNSGASLCASFLFGTTLHIANIGTNLVFLVVIKPNKEIRVELLNADILHQPTSPQEIKRLKDFAQQKNKDLSLMVPHHFDDSAAKYNGRLAGDLKTSRALGFCFSTLEEDGLSHELETKHIDLSIPQNEIAFVVTASANLISKSVDPVEHIKLIFAKHAKESPDMIAKAIAIEMQIPSLPPRSHAVCVMPLTNSTELTSHVKYTSVISSHGNNHAADIIHKAFHNTLLEQVKALNLSMRQHSGGTIFEKLTAPTGVGASTTYMIPPCKV